MTDTELKTSYLTVTQLNTLTGRVIEIINAGLMASGYPLLEKLIRSVGEEHKTLSEVLNQSQRSEFTARLKEYDDIRDDAFVALRDYIDSATRRRKKPELQAAATKINALFEKHGNTLYNLGYADQTGKMHRFLADLQASEMLEALDAAGAGELYKEMRDAQAQFEQLVQTKLGEEKPEERAKQVDVVPALKSHLVLLIRNILFLADEGDAAAMETGRRIHEAVEDIMTIAKARKTRAAGEEGAQGE